MKVLIVGAGISGLSTYIALYKNLLPLVPSLSIRLVESHASLVEPGPKASPLASTSTIVGAGLGVAPNGLRAIHSISPKAVQYITNRAFVIHGAERFVLRSSSGATLGASLGGSKESYGGFGMAMVPRGVVIEALMQALQELGGDANIEWGRKVAAVKELGAEGVEVEYADGTKEVVDLVIGADGVRSRVRDSLFEGKYPAQYVGVIGVEGFIPVALLPPTLKDSLMQEGKNREGAVMTFGNKGVFAYTLCTPRSVPDEHNEYGPILHWWSTYEGPEPSFSSARAKTIADAAKVKEELLKLYGSWKSPIDGDNSDTNGVLKSIIELGCVSEDEADTLTYHHTPVRLLPRYAVPSLESYVTPTHTGRIILLGDAAHAMPPDAAQGVSCAAEDSVVYSLLLTKLLSRESNSLTEIPDGVLRDAARAYNDIRQIRVSKIVDLAMRRVNRKKEMSVIRRWLRDLAVRVRYLLPESPSDYRFSYDSEKAVEDYLAERPASAH